MATVPQAKLSGLSRAALALGLLAVLTSGCVTTGDHKPEASKPPPPCTPWQMVATWQNHIVYAPDPTRGGVPSGGLAGRLYLFGKVVGNPVTAEGSFAVAVYDDALPDSPPVHAWNIDAKTLERLCRQDMLGWGYTVFLPWPDYPASLTRLKIRCCFLPEKSASPIYCEAHVTLAPENGNIQVNQGPPSGPITPLPSGTPPWQQGVPPASGPSVPAAQAPSGKSVLPPPIPMPQRHLGK